MRAGVVNMYRPLISFGLRLHAVLYRSSLEIAPVRSHGHKSVLLLLLLLMMMMMMMMMLLNLFPHQYQNGRKSTHPQVSVSR